MKTSVAARLLTPGLAWACVGGLMLSGCGQKGPLTLPSSPAKAASAPAATPAK